MVYSLRMLWQRVVVVVVVVALTLARMPAVETRKSGWDGAAVWEVA